MRGDARHGQALVKEAGRKRDLGEVYTPRHVADRMVDLAGDAIESGRVLEPACGNGNLLVPVLSRKLRGAWAAGDVTWRRVCLALTQVYGVDIDDENVREARARLLGAVSSLREWSADELAWFRWIIGHNVVRGDTYAAPGDVMLPEWSEAGDGSWTFELVPLLP